MAGWAGLTNRVTGATGLEQHVSHPASGFGKLKTGAECARFPRIHSSLIGTDDSEAVTGLRRGITT